MKRGIYLAVLAFIFLFAVSMVTAANSSKNVSNQTNQSQIPPPPSSGFNLILYMIITVVVLVVVILIYLLFLRPKTTDYS